MTSDTAIAVLTYDYGHCFDYLASDVGGDVVFHVDGIKSFRCFWLSSGEPWHLARHKGNLCSSKGSIAWMHQRENLLNQFKRSQSDLSNFRYFLVLLIYVPWDPTFTNILRIYDNQKIVDQLVVLSSFQETNQMLRGLRIGIEIRGLDGLRDLGGIGVLVLFVKIFEEVIGSRLRLQLLADCQQDGQEVLLIEWICWINSQFNNQIDQCSIVLKEYFELLFDFDQVDQNSACV